MGNEVLSARSSAVWGGSLALLGILIVEALLAAGLRPLTPLGWPGGGMLVAAALYGARGALGGALVAGIYLATQTAMPERFPAFFATPAFLLSWVGAFGGLTWLMLTLHRRLTRSLVSAQALSASEERFRHLAEMSTDWYWEQDENFRFTFMSGALRERTGIDAEQHLGKTRWELPEQHVTEEQWRQHRAQLQHHLPFRDFVMRRPDRNGRPHWVSISGEPVFDAAGRFSGYRGIGRDITAHVLAENALRDAKQRLELALEGSGTALWDTDLATGEVVLSAAWSEMLGGPAVPTRSTIDELVKLIHPDDLQAALHASMETVRGKRHAYSHEHRVRASDGRWIWILSRGRVIERDRRTGRAVRMIGTNIDITARRMAEERMQDLAQHDGLTGTANRALLFERINRALVRAKRAERRPALLYLDLDHFKAVNDRLGHAAGDALLKEFAARLGRSVREADTVARVGGDEFVVLLEDVGDGEGAKRIAEKIAGAVHEPARADGHEVAMTTSIGVALHDRAESADEWLKRADAALYEAKSAGRDTVKLAA
jgi:diguanylate cyclase (GGDEF)-like protein/PAS domain S-box-containing protein